MRGGGSIHQGGGFGRRPGVIGLRGGVRGGFGHRPYFRSRFGFYGYPIYPSFYGGLGYYDPYWSAPYPDTSAGYAADYSYPSDAAPPVIVNQEFQQPPAPEPTLREYSFSPSGPPASVERKYGETLYLIAFSDGVIRAVLAYWVEGASLHYVTMDHEQTKVPLSTIDRALSERLNTERNVTFQLPR